MSNLFVGTVAFDSIETPFGKAERVLGGSATYASLAASYCSSNNSILSIVGGDFKKENITLFLDKKIDLSGLSVDKTEKTFFWSGKYRENMDFRDTLETQLNVLEKFNPVVPDKNFYFPALMLGNLDPNIQLSVLSQLRKRPGVVVLDTMDFWMDSFLEKLLSVIRLVDVLIINEEEVLSLAGLNNLNSSVDRVLGLGPRFLVVKQGESGASLFSRGRAPFFVPAFPVKSVVDPTGAGDSFAGGFVGSLSTKRFDYNSAKEGVVSGCLLASFCVEGFGVEALLNISQEELSLRRSFLLKNIS